MTPKQEKNATEFFDKSEEKDLDGDAVAYAVEMANEATHAGLDPHEQLVHGIRAYLAAVSAKAIPEG